MIIREISNSDLNTINKLNEQQDFKITSLKNKVVDAIVEDNDIIAYGVVKVFAEAIILVDKDASIIKRVKALRKLMTRAFLGCKEHGIEQIHVFVKDEKLAKSLEKHFGFTKTSDIVLVKNLEL